MYKRLMAIGLTGSLLFGACGNSDGEQDTGDIIANQPAEVMEVWQKSANSGKYALSGYRLYLDTEECPAQELPANGQAVNPRCEVRRHIVSPKTFRQFNKGDSVTWNGDKRPSEVQDRRYTWRSRPYYETVYTFRLLVKQCVQVDAAPQCVQDFVSVNLDTWLDAERGETITFSGKPNEVVSD